jgi:hypothetical protein
MTAPDPVADDDPIVVDLDDDAIPLSDLAPAEAGPRALAVLALQEQMASIGLNLPLGPSLHLNDPVRLLVLNGFRVQLVEAPYGADLLQADAGPWQQTAGAPHFLLAAWVDEDLQVVRFPGVLTHDEVGQLAKTGAETLALPLEGFRGGPRFQSAAGCRGLLTMGCWLLVPGSNPLPGWCFAMGAEATTATVMPWRCWPSPWGWWATASAGGKPGPGPWNGFSCS